MAAPTPVSSLVFFHLAGVYLIVRFNRVIVSRGLNLILLFISIFTVIGHKSII
jgi:NADH:ubiquinone oxidoreductase subunit 5 (subunit L)/multisubunit Na+/H+ antiporter MnhA subunit